MASWPEFAPVELLRQLAGREVDFVVIGGIAVVVQALPRFTRDVDITYATTPQNLEALGSALLELDARLRGVTEELPFVADARTLRGTQILCLSTALGEIDLLAAPAGAASYAMLRRRALTIDLDGARVRIAAIADLIAMKRAAGRPQDLLDIEALEHAQLLHSGAGRPRRSRPAKDST